MAERILVGAVLPVPEPWRSLLAAARTGLGDPLGDLVPAHITLLPHTWVRPGELPGLVRHVRTVAAAQVPVVMELDGVASFHPTSDVVYLPLTIGARECADLAAALRSGPVAVDLAYPFHPHLTLAHNRGPGAYARARSLLGRFRAAFTATELALSTSTGSLTEWKPLQRIALTGTPAPASARLIESSPAARRP